LGISDAAFLANFFETGGYHYIFREVSHLSQNLTFAMCGCPLTLISDVWGTGHPRFPDTARKLGDQMYDYNNVVELPPTDIADAEAYLAKQERDGGKVLFGLTGTLMLAGGVVFGNAFVAPALAGTSGANQASGSSFGTAATAAGQNADLNANTGLASGGGIVIRGASLTRLPVTAGSGTAAGKTFGRTSAGFGSGRFIQPGGAGAGFSSASPSPFTSSSASPSSSPSASADPSLAAAAALSKMPALDFSTTSTATTATGSAHSAAGSSSVGSAAAGSVSAGASSTSHTTQTASAGSAASNTGGSSSASVTSAAAGSTSSSSSSTSHTTQAASKTSSSSGSSSSSTPAPTSSSSSSPKPTSSASPSSSSSPAASPSPTSTWRQRQDSTRTGSTVLAATARVHNDD
jgi:hypothetical protein